MATGVKVGQRVRINESYGEIGGREFVGEVFEVTDVTSRKWISPDGQVFENILGGDPMGRSVWENFVDVVPTKTNTSTIVKTKLTWPMEDRIVSISNGSKGLSLSVNPEPSVYGDVRGQTSLTLEQAEEIAQDLLARVAEIRSFGL